MIATPHTADPPRRNETAQRAAIWAGPAAGFTFDGTLQTIAGLDAIAHTPDEQMLGFQPDWDNGLDVVRLPPDNLAGMRFALKNQSARALVRVFGIAISKRGPSLAKHHPANTSAEERRRRGVLVFEPHFLLDVEPATSSSAKAVPEELYGSGWYYADTINAISNSLRSAPKFLHDDNNGDIAELQFDYTGFGGLVIATKLSGSAGTAPAALAVAVRTF